MAFTNIFIIGLVLQMELRGEGAGEWLYLQGFMEHAGGNSGASRKLQGMQTIVVHEVLLGLESAGGLWHMGEEKGGNAWFGVVGLGLWVWAQWRHHSAPCSPIPPLHLHLPTLTPAQSQAQNEYSSVARNI